MAAALGRRARLRGDRSAGASQVLLPRHVRVSVGARARGARPQLHDRGRDRAHEADAWVQRPASVRLGRLRPSGRERGHQEPVAPRDLDARQHRPHEGAVAAARHQLCLGPRVRDVRGRLLPVEPVVVPADVRARPRLSAPVDGQLVPGLRHRAGQRAGGRRGVLALRVGGRAARSRSVVPAHHRVRRRAARRHRAARRVARQGADDAAELDWALRGGAGPVRGRVRRVGRRGRGRDRGLHDPHRHHLRGDVRPAGAGASAGVPLRRSGAGPRPVP